MAKALAAAYETMTRRIQAKNEAAGKWPTVAVWWDQWTRGRYDQAVWQRAVSTDRRKTVDRVWEKVGPVIGDVAMDDVSPNHIQRALANFGDQEGARHKARAILHSCFRDAGRIGWIDEKTGVRMWAFVGANPVNAVPTLYESPGKPFWAEAQLQLLMQHAERLGSARAVGILALMAGFGVRLGEALMLRWEQVIIHPREDEGIIGELFWPAEDRKVPLPLVLPLPSKLMRFFPERREAKDFVWLESAANRRTVTNEVVDLLRAAATAAGLPHADTVTPHSLRYSVAAALEEAGVPVRGVQAVLGHKSPLTTESYLQSSRKIRQARVVSPIVDRVTGGGR